MSAKKKKPVSQEFSTVNPEVGEQPLPEGMSASDVIEARSGTVGISLSEEVKQKLDAFEAVSSENAKYAEMVADLHDRIAAYIGEISDLKAQLAQERELNNGAAPQADAGRIAELESENEKLHGEISALNARLAVESKKTEQPPRQVPRPIQQFRPAYSRPFTSDGYQSWN